MQKKTPNDQEIFTEEISQNVSELSTLIEQLRLTNSQLAPEQRLKLAVIRLILPNDLLIPELAKRSANKLTSVVIDEIFIEVAEALFPEVPSGKIKDY